MFLLYLNGIFCVSLAVLTNVVDHSDTVTAHGGTVSVHITNGQPKVYTTRQYVYIVTVLSGQ